MFGILLGLGALAAGALAIKEGSEEEKEARIILKNIKAMANRAIAYELAGEGEIKSDPNYAAISEGYALSNRRAKEIVEKGFAEIREGKPSIGLPLLIELKLYSEVDY